jgi:hypothetical protein
LLKKHVEEEVFAEPQENLLNVNETQYLDYLARKYLIDPLVIHFENVEVTQAEKTLEMQRGAWHGPVVTFHVPASGDLSLLRMQPGTRLGWSIPIGLEQGGFSFDVANLDNYTAEQMQRRADDLLNNIKQQAEYVADEVGAHNRNLRSFSADTVRRRKTDLLRRQKLVSELRFPVRRAVTTPQTFVVPTPPRRVIIKPASSNIPFTPEPTIDDESYAEILQVLEDVGRGLERLPSSYLGKGEEDLRDLLLVYLGTNFPSATGETFNRAGKTDVLIRHEGSNLFVAECKFWTGEKGFLATIDQALNYLTWRDSKAAILTFVKQKNLQPVLDAIGAAAARHPCYARDCGRRSESLFQFEFCLPTDETRSVRVAVMCFHFPEGREKAPGAETSSGLEIS